MSRLSECIRWPCIDAADPERSPRPLDLMRQPSASEVTLDASSPAAVARRPHSRRPSGIAKPDKASATLPDQASRCVVPPPGFEPGTNRLSDGCSNLLPRCLKAQTDDATAELRRRPRMVVDIAHFFKASADSPYPFTTACTLIFDPNRATEFFKRQSTQHM